MPRVVIRDDEWMLYYLEEIPEGEEDHHKYVKVSKRFIEKYNRTIAKMWAMQGELEKLYRV